jgi:hypothetical protein
MRSLAFIFPISKGKWYHMDFREWQHSSPIDELHLVINLAFFSILNHHS